MALYPSPDDQKSFEITGLSVQEKKFNIDFQDDGHLGFPIRMILATFDLRHLDTSYAVSNQLAFLFIIKNVHNRFSTWLLGRSSWISNQNHFSYF